MKEIFGKIVVPKDFKNLPKVQIWSHCTLVMSEMQKWFFLFLETSIFTDFLNGPTPASFSFILSLFNQTIQFYKKSM